MSKESLTAHLEALKSEINALTGDNEADRERLATLIQQIEDQIDVEIATEEEEEPVTVDSLRHMAEKFEVEHPKITKAINEIMTTLSNMGI